MDDACARVNGQIAEHKAGLARVLGDACSLCADLCGLVSEYGCADLFVTAVRPERYLLHAYGDQSWWGRGDGHLESGGRTWLEEDDSKYHVFKRSLCNGNLLRFSVKRRYTRGPLEVAFIAKGKVSEYSVHNSQCWSWLASCLMADADGRDVVVVPCRKNSTLAAFDAETGKPIWMSNGKLDLALASCSRLVGIDRERLLVVNCDNCKVYDCCVVSWPQLETLARWMLDSKEEPDEVAVSSVQSLVRFWTGEALTDYDLLTGRRVNRRKVAAGLGPLVCNVLSGVCYTSLPGLLCASL